MAEISLPVHGEKDWGNKLNAAVNAVNDEAKAASEGVGGLEELVTNGRLSESMLERFIIDDGEGRVPDSSLPSRLTVQGISQTVNLANQPALDAVAQIPTVITGQIDAKVQPLVAEAIAADNTPALAAAAAVQSVVADLELVEVASLDDEWVWAIIYQDREVALGMRADGSFYPDSLNPSPDTGSAVESVLLERNQGWIWAIMYQDGEVAVGLRNDGTIYPGDADAGKKAPIVNFGDSLSAGWASSQPALGIKLGRQISNQGIGGQTSVQISARQGGRPTMVTVTGGVIPATGSVPVALSKALRSDSTTSVPGVLAGVAGLIKADASPYLTGVFTRSTAGFEVQLPVSADGTPHPVPFQTGFAFRNHWPIFWVGRNNFKGENDAAQIVADLTGMMAWIGDDARQHALILSIPPWVGEEFTGSRGRLDLANNAIRDAFPTAYVDTSAMLRSAAMLTAVGIAPTAEDLTNIANGLTPASFRSDSGHLNAKGYEALNLITEMIYTSKGWN